MIISEESEKMIFLKKKKKIINLLKTTNEMVGLFLLHKKQVPELVEESCTAVEAIEKMFTEKMPEAKEILQDLSLLHDIFQLVFEKKVKIDPDLIQKIQNLLAVISDKVAKEVPNKLNIAFMPYKVTMWDSLASIYEAACKDPDCVAKVIPIPYYKITADKAIPVYEGKLFPANVSIISYDDYDLNHEEPDIIFIHNAYDQYNTITQVDKRFFTSNLQQYTDMLVYVPYHITSFSKMAPNRPYITYAIPTMINIDKIIVAGQFVKDAAVKYGIPKGKILVLGSPKMDVVRQAIKDRKKIPKKWQEKLTNKYVFALDTNCMDFVNREFYEFAYIEQVFDAARMIPNCAVIWRPHPLTRISIAHYVPQMLSMYDNYITEIKYKSSRYPNIILDDSSDYLSFFKASDAYISATNSLMAAYTLTDQPIIISAGKLGSSILLSDEAFYHFYDPSYPWYKIADNLVKGIDPKKDYRHNLASQIYSYTDGTSGKMIYQEIKREVILKTVGETK